MHRYIERVDYRHPIVPTAYILVTGRTQCEAETNAKRVGTAIINRFPGLKPLAFRPKGYDKTKKLWRCEVPVILGSLGTTAAFSELVLQGSV
jgi:hypothetical protein